MKSDIDNWVNFLNDTTSKANITDIKFDKESVSRDLKLCAVPMLKQFIGDVKGRQLTNLLLNLEKSFVLCSKQLKKEKILDSDIKKLSFFALSNVVVEILREMRLDAYKAGKDFDPIKFLTNYEKTLEDETSFDKKKRTFDHH